MTTHPLSTPPAATPATDAQQLATTKIQKGSKTDHELKLAGGTIRYSANADWMVLRKKEKPIAEMFYVSYARTEADAGENRPVTFVFNGGPGAASAYLHVGALGPRRVQFADDGSLLAPPSKLTDNESTWLSFTDLIFVDPIGTGFSRTIDEDPAGKPDPAAPKPEAKENDEFFQVNRDLESIGEFMSRFLSKNNLWSRPIFIAGESYGGFRVGKLAKSLQEGFGIGLNGAILISPALELNLLDGSDYDILMWSDLFPTLVASSVHHGRSKAFAKGLALEKFLPEVEKFAGNELLRLLAVGDALPETERHAIFDKMISYLGLSREFVYTKAGRISHVQFVRELLRDERKVIGLYDGTMTALDPFPDRETFQGADPTLFAIERVFTAGINVQLRETLNVQTEFEYHLLSMKVNTAWKIDSRKHAFETQIGATDDLRYAMALNPHMKVFITHGYYDLVTPYYASSRLASLMKLTPEQTKNLTVKHFKGGHMFYAWKESRAAFKDSLQKFYKAALGA